MKGSQMPSALVLGSGGSRASFEVGALRYLRERRANRPEFRFPIITACSAGAVNAAKLAEGDAAWKELERMWMGMRTNNDMYVPRHWPPNENPFAEEYEDADTPLVDMLIAPVLNLIRVGKELEVVVKVLNSNSLFSLSPIAQLLERVVDPAKVAASGIKLRLATVSLEMGHLRYVTETGAIVARDGKTPVRASWAPSSDTVTPACRKLSLDWEEARRAVERLQKQLHDTGEEHGAEGKAELIEAIHTAEAVAAEKRLAMIACIQKQGGLRPVTVPLLQGVIASAAIPGIFEPQAIGGETYTDGGVREAVPIRAAIDLGADRVIAIGVAAQEPEPSLFPYAPPVESRGTGFIPDIVARALADIMVAEIQRNELQPDNPWPVPVTVIQPRLMVHDSLTIDPKLIRIRRRLRLHVRGRRARARNRPCEGPRARRPDHPLTPPRRGTRAFPRKLGGATSARRQAARDARAQAEDP
jgi:NTE family protein